MDEDALPQEVQRLVNDPFESTDHVEVLFRINQGGEVSADSLARDTHMQLPRVERILRDLEQAKLIVRDGGLCRTTQNPRERAAVEEFAATYNARPLTVIRAVYARPSSLRSFADAFRLRRED